MKYLYAKLKHGAKKKKRVLQQDFNAEIMN
jgi:hypothetical protein